jgi:hypothetical protein
MTPVANDTIEINDIVTTIPQLPPQLLPSFTPFLLLFLPLLTLPANSPPQGIDLFLLII